MTGVRSKRRRKGSSEFSVSDSGRLSNDGRLSRSPDVLILVACLVSLVLTLIFWGTFGFTWASSAYQLLDYNLLASDALRSLWYCHAQPPLFNALTAVGLKLSLALRMWPGVIFAIFNLALVVLSVWCVARLIEEYVSEPRVRWLLVLAYVLNPSVYAYSGQWFYDLLCYGWFLVFLAGWLIWMKGGRLVAYAASVGGAVLLVWTRSHFSVPFAGVLVILSGLSRWYVTGRGHRAWPMVAAIGLAMMAFWPAKNAMLFGMPASSSWESYTLARATPWASAWYGDFYRNEALDMEAVRRCPYQHPVLLCRTKSPYFGTAEGPNWNHYKLLLMREPYVRRGVEWRLHHRREWMEHAAFFYTKACLHDAAHLLQQPSRGLGHRFWTMLDLPNRCVLYADLTSLLPSGCLHALETIKIRLVGWLSADEWVPVQVSAFALLVLPGFAAMALGFLVRGSREERVAAGGYPITMGYMFGTTILTDGNEGYRMVFAVKGGHIMLGLCGLRRVAKWWRRRHDRQRLTAVRTADCPRS